MQPFAPRRYGALERVTARVFVVRHVVNSVIVLGDEATAVIDTQVNVPMAARVLQHARALADKPVRYAINTHYHWDHTAGNHLFHRAGALVVSGARTRTLMQTREAQQRAFLVSRGFELGPMPYLADETIADTGELDIGNQRLCLHYLGQAETADAMAIYLPQEGCMVAGDTVMTGSFPMFGQPVMREGLLGTAEWLETLAYLERFQAAHVLPGHGPVAHAAELALFKRLAQYFLTEVAARVAQQMPLPALLEDLENHLPAWITDIPIVWGTPRYAILRVYSGLVATIPGGEGWQHYKPSALPAADARRVDTACEGVTALEALHHAMHECEDGGDVGSAIAIARRATALVPHAPMAWVELAECLIRGAGSVVSVLEKGDFFSEARHALHRALALEPHHAAAHLALGRFLVMMAYRSGNDPVPGMRHLRQVIARVASPPDGPQTALLAPAYFYLGMGHRTLGEEAQAIECFRTALVHQPTFHPALLALQS